jgi:hypothetical protein
VPAWFAAKELELRASIAARNRALDAVHRQPQSMCNRTLLSEARTQHGAAVRRAKSDWIVERCSNVSNMPSKVAWDNVKLLRAGLAPPKRAAPAKMQKADGSFATSPEENAGVFAVHFEQLYGRKPSFDASVLDALPQRALVPGLDGAPTDTYGPRDSSCAWQATRHVTW